MRKPIVAALIGTLLVPVICQAELGGKINVTPSLKMSIKAAVPVQTQASYSVHELIPESGGSIKQYADAAGVVFAVTWKTPVLPDLQTLLGANYFAAYKSETATKAHAGRGPVRINQNDFVIFSGGRLKAFSGKAYVPSLLPAGFNTDAIQ